MTGDELKTIRVSMRLTQSELARAVGVSGDRTVRKWEAGERRVPPAVAKLVALLIQYTDANNGDTQ